VGRTNFLTKIIMAGEILKSKTLPEAQEELRLFYSDQSVSFKPITKEEYEKIDKDEREDSENHAKHEQFENGAEVVNFGYYRYLPERKVAHRMVLKNKAGETLEDYFVVIPNLA
jgi:hypothetical protein